MSLWDRRAVLGVVLVGLGAAVFLPDLGQETRLASREARHAEIARGMVESGQWIVPHLYGRPYVDKAPLYNWTVAGLFFLSGRIDFLMARLPSAVCAIVSMVGLGALGRRWLGGRAGFLAAVIWATFWIVVEWGRASRMDMMMACLILYAVWLADVGATHQSRAEDTGPGRPPRGLAAWAGACAVMGLAVLTKGPYALLFFGVAVIALWRARTRRWSPPVGWLAIGAALIAAVGATWAVATEMSHPGHLNELLDYQFRDAADQHPGRVSLYIDQLLLKTLPWALFVPGAVVGTLRRWRREGYGQPDIAPVVFLVCLAVLTAVPNRRAHFALPVLPMLALWIGGYVDQALGQARARGLEWTLRMALGGLLAALLAGVVLWPQWAYSGHIGGAMFLALAAGVTGWGVVLAWRGRRGPALAVLLGVCAGMSAAATPLLTRWYLPPSAEAAVVREIAAVVPAEAPLAAHGVPNEYLFFKLNRPVTYAYGSEDIQRFLAGGGRRYLLMAPDYVYKARRATDRPVRTVKTWTWERKAVTLVAVGEPVGSGDEGPGRRDLPGGGAGRTGDLGCDSRIQVGRTGGSRTYAG